VYEFHLTLPPLAPNDRASARGCSGGGEAKHNGERGPAPKIQQQLGRSANSFEIGRRRIPVSTLPLLAKALDTSTEDLIGESGARARSKRGPSPKIQQQLERVSQLPRARQRMVSEVLDSLLAQAR